MTGNRTNPGLAAMPPQQRPSLGDGGGRGGDPSYNERQHREAMARNSSPQGPRPRSHPRVGAEPGRWDEADWDRDHEEAAGHHARRLLSSGSNSSFHRAGDKLAALRRWLIGERWVRRLAVVMAALAVIFVGCFFALWWRLGAGPINNDTATT